MNQRRVNVGTLYRLELGQDGELLPVDQPPQYPRLPEPPTAQASDTTWLYGAALFAFVVREGVTATLSVEQLELADHAGITAVAGPDTAERARATLTRTRRLIVDALASRPADPVPELDQAHAEDRPNLGPMARLVTPPDTRPPGGLAVDPRPARPTVDVQF